MWKKARVGWDDGSLREIALGLGMGLECTKELNTVPDTVQRRKRHI